MKTRKILKNKHILFVHIPKTAGTSFRKAAQEYFSEENTFFDYSPKSSETSKLILKEIYEHNDPYMFHRSVMQYHNSFLSGHFPLSKYAHIYNAKDIVSFVRSPVAQVLSHYNHYKNYNDYKKDLESFIEDPRFRNIQSRMLNHMHISLCGFIGLTEEYNTSIDIFNNLFDIKLQHKFMNTKREGSIDIDDISPEIIDRITELNADDMNLYQNVKKKFKIHEEMYKKELPFTYGMVQVNNKKTIRGVAYQVDSDKTLKIDIYHKDYYLTTVSTTELRPGLIGRNVPRKGYVGFGYQHNNRHFDGKLRAIVKETGQELF